MIMINHDKFTPTHLLIRLKFIKNKIKIILNSYSSFFTSSEQLQTPVHIWDQTLGQVKKSKYIWIMYTYLYTVYFLLI